MKFRGVTEIHISVCATEIERGISTEGGAHGHIIAAGSLSIVGTEPQNVCPSGGEQSRSTRRRWIAKGHCAWTTDFAPKECKRRRWIGKAIIRCGARQIQTTRHRHRLIWSCIDDGCRVERCPRYPCGSVGQRPVYSAA